MKKRIFTGLIFTLVLSVLFANVSFAAVGLLPELHPKGAPTISGNLPEEEAGQGIDEQRLALTRRITNIVFGIASIVAVFFIVQNGWSMAASAGSEEKVTQAKKGLTWAAIGLLLIIMSYSIIRFVITMPFQAHDEGSVTAEQSAAENSELPVPSEGPFVPYDSNPPPADDSFKPWGTTPDPSDEPDPNDAPVIPVRDPAAAPVIPVRDPADAPVIPVRVRR